MKPRSRPSTASAVIVSVLLLGIVLAAWRHDIAGGGAPAFAGMAPAIPAPVPVPTPRITITGSSVPGPAGLPTPVPIAAPTLGTSGSGSLAFSGASRVASATGMSHDFSSASLPWEGLAGCALLGCLGLGYRRRLARRRTRSGMRDAGLRKGHTARRIAPFTAALIALTLTVGTLPPMRAAASQSPSAYLGNAIDWLRANYVERSTIDWPTLRRRALAMAHGARTAADTYPALFFVARQLGDPGTFLFTAAMGNRRYDSGFNALYPGGEVYSLAPGGAAARAGLRLGDRVISINGHPITGNQFTTTIDPTVVARVRLVVRRSGQVRALVITIVADPFQDQVGNPSTGRLFGTDSRTVGYIDLQSAPGGPASTGQERWPDQTQGVIRTLDQADPCGWMVDLRDTSSGDLWSYLAAMGPLLNPGVSGGFANSDGTVNHWSYRAGKVYWNGMERRVADVLAGPAYTLRRSGPPIAVLTDRLTLSAGELMAIMFAEHSPSRRFGEPTAGSPNEVTGTALSDGASLVTSIANGVDDQGIVYYNRPLKPDQVVAIDWANRGGSLSDPVVRAATAWLAAQRACRR